MHKYLYPFFLVLLHTFTTSGSPNDSTHIIHYNIDNGLPTNNIYSIIQDRNNYLWFATEKGAVKYNGYTFRTFNMSDNLPADDVWKLVADSRDRIWVFTSSNQGGYIKNDEYSNIKSAGDARFLHKDNLFEINKNIFFFYSNKGSVIAMVDSNGYEYDIFKVEDNINLIMGVMNNRLLVLNSKNTLESVGIKNGHLDKTTVCVNFNDRELKGYIRKQGKYYYAYYYNANYFEIFDFLNCKYEFKKITQYGSEPNDKVYVTTDYNDSVVIVTNKYLFTFNNEFKLIRKTLIESIIPEKTQLSWQFADSMRNCWYTTTAKGVYMYPNASLPLNANKGLNILKSTTYMGRCNNGSTIWYDKSDNITYTLTKDLKIKFTNRYSDPPQTVVPYNDSSVIVFFSVAPSFIYNTVNNSRKFFLDSTKNFYVNMHQLAGPDVWTESRKMLFNRFLGLYKYNQKYFLNNFSGIFHLKENPGEYKMEWLAEGRYSQSEPDSFNNKFWFYNKEAIALLDPNINKVVSCSTALFSLFNITMINSIKSDHYGNTYMLTNNKLIQFNLSQMKLKILYTNVDLSESWINIYSNKIILYGKFGIAYSNIKGPMSCDVFKYTVNAKNIYYRYINNVVPISGSNVIINTDKNVYSLNIEDVLHAKTVNPADKNFIGLVVISPNQKIIQNSDTIVLSSNTEKISFDLINYYGIGERKYLYRTSDNNEWQQSTTGEVFLNNLKAENYYKIECIGSDDAWISDSRSFYVYRIPYWWQTKTWRNIFWISGIFLLIAIIIAIIMITRYVGEKANRKRQATTELELRAIYSQINPHFIFNTLSTALFFISKKQFEEAYDHVTKFSKLLRSYLKASQERYVTLSEEIKMLKNYIELQQIRFEEKFDFKINVENKIPVDNIQIPSLLLQPLVENAINHGLFHKGAGGLLKIEFYQGTSNDELICIIDDNGIGREKAKELRNNSTINYDSYGTKLTQQLIDIFEKYEQMNIGIMYIDKKDPENGTTVKLTLRNLKYVA